MGGSSREHGHADTPERRPPARSPSCASEGAVWQTKAERTRCGAPLFLTQTAPCPPAIGPWRMVQPCPIPRLRCPGGSPTGRQPRPHRLSGTQPPCHQSLAKPTTVREPGPLLAAQPRAHSLDAQPQAQSGQKAVASEGRTRETQPAGVGRETRAFWALCSSALSLLTTGADLPSSWSPSR